MKAINEKHKNTEIVGVSDALKSYYSTCKSITSQNDVDDSNCDFSIMDNKITINPSSSTNEPMRCDNMKIVINNDDIIEDTCGWCEFRPKYIKRFMSAKWTLLFLCIAGAVQGDFY